MEKYTPFGHSDYQTIVADIKKFATGQAHRGRLDHQRRLERSLLQGARQPGPQGRRTSRSSPSRSAKKSCAASTPSRSSVTSLPGTTSCRIDTPENKAFVDKWKAYVKKANLPDGDKRVTNDPMEATYIGIHMWAQAVEQAGTTDIDAVRQAVGWPDLQGARRASTSDGRQEPPPAQAGLIGEVKADGQFQIVWKTEDPIRAQAVEPVHPRQRQEGRRLDAIRGPAATARQPKFGRCESVDQSLRGSDRSS